MGVKSDHAFPVVLHAKPGTHAACFFRVKRLRRDPRVGETFEARRSDHLGHVFQRYYGPRDWDRWRVVEVKAGYGDAHGELFMLEAA